MRPDANTTSRWHASGYTRDEVDVPDRSAVLQDLLGGVFREGDVRAPGARHGSVRPRTQCARRVVPCFENGEAQPVRDTELRPGRRYFAFFAMSRCEAASARYSFASAV